MLSFGERLRKIRRDHFIRQKQLADFLNIAVSTLSQYENNKRHPNYDILTQIALYFNVSSDYLLGIEESKREAITQKIDAIDGALNGNLSYSDLIHKITDHLSTINENNDTKSLKILHDLYSSVASIGIEYKTDVYTNDSIETILSNHLSHKEDIDQTLNKLFRHHIKLCSERAT